MPFEGQQFKSTEQKVDNSSQTEPKQYNPNSDLKAKIAEMEDKDKRIDFLEAKKVDGTLSPKEEAELKALVETGNVRIAFLEAKKVDGTLSPKEKAELKALVENN